MEKTLSCRRNRSAYEQKKTFHRGELLKEQSSQVNIEQMELIVKIKELELKNDLLKETINVLKKKRVSIGRH